MATKPKQTLGSDVSERDILEIAQANAGPEELDIAKAFADLACPGCKHAVCKQSHMNNALSLMRHQRMDSRKRIREGRDSDDEGAALPPPPKAPNEDRGALALTKRRERVRNWLEFPLKGGLYVQFATWPRILAEIDYHRKLKNTHSTYQRWLELVYEKRGDSETVGEAFDNDALEALFRQAEQEAENSA